MKAQSACRQANRCDVGPQRLPGRMRPHRDLSRGAGSVASRRLDFLEPAPGERQLHAGGMTGDELHNRGTDRKPMARDVDRSVQADRAVQVQSRIRPRRPSCIRRLRGLHRRCQLQARRPRARRARRCGEGGGFRGRPRRGVRRQQQRRARRLVEVEVVARSPRPGASSRTSGRRSGRPSVAGFSRAPPRKSSSMNFR